MLDQFTQWYSQINKAKADSVFAPHKPITLLYSLSKVLKGQRWIEYNRDRKELEKIIGEHTKFSSKPNCLQPLWRLSNDSKKIPIWSVNPSQIELNNKGDINPGVASKSNFKAGFSDEFYHWLMEDKGSAHYLIKEIIYDNFPDSLHGGLLEMLGYYDIILDRVPTDIQEYSISKIKRDPKFPPQILALYGNQCAFCGLNITFKSNDMLNMEAAHIKWKKYGGECLPKNGLSLCPTHHYTFDRGIWSADRDYRIKLSENIIIDRKQDTFFEPFVGLEITRFLKDLSNIPAEENLIWHKENILK